MITSKDVTTFLSLDSPKKWSIEKKIDPSIDSIRSDLQKHNPVRCLSGDIRAFLEATVFLDPQLSDEECTEK